MVKLKYIKKYLNLVPSLLLIVVLLISATYAYTKKTFFGTKKQIITVAENLELKLEEGTTENISLTNAYPLTDEEGKKVDSYNFSLTNPGFTDCNYSIYLVDNELESGQTRVGDAFIKYYLTNDSKETQMTPALLSTLESDELGRVLEKNTIQRTATINYTLRFWVDYGATQEDVAGNVFSVKIKVVQTKELYHDETGANVPVLATGMIPVLYDETSKEWVKADLTEEWYDYEKQNWANAVTVTENTRDSYMALDAGEPVSMEDINTMWVWIPRYEYKYTNLEDSYAGGTLTLPGEIEINFITEEITIPSDSNTFRIPEGFTFGSENIPGLWVGKFETSTKEMCTATSDSIEIACDLLTLTPEIKPNATSWRGARVSTFFEASRLMQSEDDNLTYNANTYGFDPTGSGTMEVHMLKNTEWGIISYLTQSKYGKYGNPTYTGENKEVYQNKSDTYITGMSNGLPSSSTYSDNQVTYDTPNIGYGASTTGTIYGIYDMSGGAGEYVMGNFNNYSGNTSGNSGFCGTNGPTNGICREWPSSKYYDLYESNNASIAYKLGDATYETAGWYNDESNYFITQDYPWFMRSGVYNNDSVSGVFHSYYVNGRSVEILGYRLAIKP